MMKKILLLLLLGSLFAESTTRMIGGINYANTYGDDSDDSEAILGFKILVCIAEVAIKIPNKYEPPSPRKTFAFGKLNLRKINNIKIANNNKIAKLLCSFK